MLAPMSGGTKKPGNQAPGSPSDSVLWSPALRHIFMHTHRTHSCKLNKYLNIFIYFNESFLYVRVPEIDSLYYLLMARFAVKG